ncbi:hypothetical protein [Chitinophaga sp. Cy-1792]|uniref:hypothetical protein n=1 Tax=Chitinophaga sp. Cy-1792 TaxID=2608339 RepID=UPI00141EA70B|nr:hypothetical protein [Chitinophaga sp. Cy-1792]NIG53639.1 hypothetical protein [Chitinophaga sp. Cy-1792]
MKLFALYCAVIAVLICSACQKKNNDISQQEPAPAEPFKCRVVETRSGKVGDNTNKPIIVTFTYDSTGRVIFSEDKSSAYRYQDSILYTDTSLLLINRQGKDYSTRTTFYTALNPVTKQPAYEIVTLPSPTDPTWMKDSFIYRYATDGLIVGLDVVHITHPTPTTGAKQLSIDHEGRILSASYDGYTYIHSYQEQPYPGSWTYDIGLIPTYLYIRQPNQKNPVYLKTGTTTYNTASALPIRNTTYRYVLDKYQRVDTIYITSTTPGSATVEYSYTKLIYACD